MKFYPGFPIRIEHMDGKDKKTCWFQCQSHLDKYLTRNKLTSKQYTVEYEDPRLIPIPESKLKKQSKPKQSAPKKPKQLFSSLEQFFTDDKVNVETVGKSTRRKSTQKRSRS